MKITAIDKIKLQRKEKTIRKLGKIIFEKAENPKNVAQIKKYLTTLHFELNSLSPKYLPSTDKPTLTLQNLINLCLEKISSVEFFSKKFDETKLDHEDWWAFVAPYLTNVGNALSEIYFDFTQTELKLISPEHLRNNDNIDEEKTYARGNAYEFYKDLSNLIKEAKKEVIITDRYPSGELFEMYLDKVVNGVRIRVLSKKIDKKLTYIASKFKLKPNVNFELRQNFEWHDRLIFIDNTCWVSGQTIKDAAVKSPTYLIKLEAYGQLKELFEQEWKNSTIIDEQFLERDKQEN
jgi:hypothetical protein